ncbi:MAG: hypothetical protein JNJ90_13240 [Saprospiraceae bacterium]|jgi:carbonic anhydrase/acetyltransferase-like protein (isoleucine patch superfamily)|nr:hypothetical protein [Saprospiraceae bacterium]
MKKQNLPFLLMLALSLCFVFNQNANAQGAGTKPELVMYRYNSSNAGAPLPVLQGDLLGTIKWNGLTAIGDIRTGATIQSFATDPVAPGLLQGNLIFQTNSGLGLKNRMIITQHGLVGIGTDNPDFHLHTVGNTHTTGDFFGRIHFDNNQNTDDAPNTYIDEAYFELKQRGVLGVPGVGTHGGLLSLAPGATSNDHQLFFGDGGIWHRRWTNNAADWTGSTWYKLLTGEDINGTPNRIAKFLTPNSLGDSQLWDDGVNVGIGTTTPTALLDVNGNTRLGGTATVVNNFGVGGNSLLSGALNVSGNTFLGAALNVSGAASLGSTLGVTGNTSLGNNLSVTNNTTVGNTLTVASNANVGANLAVNASATVGADARVNGRVIVGNPASTPGTHAMYVNGSIVATEVKVALQANWPDYVFEPDYALPNLNEWEQFISQNKHLPGVPSAAEVSQDGGIELGEMNRILLQKVEELTLLLISQQKQIDALKAGR